MKDGLSRSSVPKAEAIRCNYSADVEFVLKSTWASDSEIPSRFKEASTAQHGTMTIQCVYHGQHAAAIIAATAPIVRSNTSESERATTKESLINIGEDIGSH